MARMLLCSWGLIGGLAVSLVGMMGTAESFAAPCSTGMLAVATQDSLIPFGVFLTGVALTAAVTWKLARDRHAIDQQMFRIQADIRSIHDRLAAIEGRLKTGA